MDYGNIDNFTVNTKQAKLLTPREAIEADAKKQLVLIDAFNMNEQPYTITQGEKKCNESENTKLV